MSVFTRGSMFLRRASVFYLFIAVLILCFALYYYKYIPDNKAEVNERALRVLNQLVNNFQRKNNDFRDILRQAHLTENLRDKHGSFDLLKEQIAYWVKPFSTAGQKPEDKSTLPRILVLPDSGWRIDYPVIQKGDSLLFSVSLKDFAKPLLGVRADIFRNYLLLYDSGRTQPQSRQLQLIYQQNELTSAGTVNADTLLSLQKNSDHSSVADIRIAGNDNKLFFQPFDFYGQHLFLAGLIDKGEYDDMVSRTPINFIPFSLIGIFFILICLPFLKVFLLSPKESLTARDVLATALSLYIGSIVVCLLLFYMSINYITDLAFSNRLQKLDSALHFDLEDELTAAGRQLYAYDRIGSESKTSPALQNLMNPLKNDPALDQRLLPKYFPDISRLFWFDSTGATIAKWTAQDFDAPKTSVSASAFFHFLQENQQPDQGEWADSFVYVSTGKSNLTDEFQVYMSKPSKAVFRSTRENPDYRSGDSLLHAFGITEVFFLHLNTKPVIPRGFGYALLDKDGNVLIDVDEKRNLAGNILQESGGNPGLLSAMQLKNQSQRIDLLMYGGLYSAQVRPLKKYGIYLLVYFDKNLLAGNMTRVLRFDILILLTLIFAVVGCLLLSTRPGIRPRKLLYSLQKIEWIRPCSANWRSYGFTVFYFGSMILLTAVTFVVLLLANGDLRLLMLISMLLPFYALLGFVISRNHDHESGAALKRSELKAMARTGGICLVFIALLNILIALPLNKATSPVLSYFTFYLFQGLVLALLVIFYVYSPADYPRLLFWALKRWKNHLTIRNRYYLTSLLFSIVLMSILPAAGIITYGFYAEKVQYKKAKLFTYARDLESRNRFLREELLPSFKKPVKELIEKHQLAASGAYLIDHDRIWQDESSSEHTAQDSLPLNDDLYVELVNSFDLVGDAGKTGPAMTNSAADSTWKTYAIPKNGQDIPAIEFRYQPVAGISGVQHIRLQTGLRNPLSDYFHLPVTLIAFSLLFLFAFGVGSISLIHATIYRLFLRNSIDKDDLLVDPEYLGQYLRMEVLQPKPVFLKDVQIPKPVPLNFFYGEFSWEGEIAAASCSQEVYILRMADSFTALYQAIWSGLSDKEKYVLYDFSQDTYTNFKNIETIYLLIQKGILVLPDDELNFFSLSFRQFLLTKKDTAEITKFRSQFSASGSWDAFRIPVLSLIAVVGIFIVATQTDFTHQVTAILTSVAALIPLVLKFFDKSGKETGKSPTIDLGAKE